MGNDPESPTKKQKRYLALPEFVDPEDLYSQIVTREAGKDFAVIDVRTREEISEHGSIVDSFHIESTIFGSLDGIEKVFEQCRHIPTLYFHCALSQVRGPKCAQKYVTFLNHSEEHRLEQQIFIVRGGFDAWKGKYGLDKKVSQNVRFGY
jgi:rhodanese-related sulfurtransferase